MAGLSALARPAESLDGPLRLAVTGGTGLVGSALLRAAAGCAWLDSVQALCRGEAPKSLRGTDWVRGDLSNEAALTRLCEGADVLIHVAGATAAPGDAGFHAVNVAGTARVVAAARRAGVRRVVLVSSQAAGVPSLSRYAASKAMGEAAAMRAAGDVMNVVVVRPPAVFGPGDEATKPILDALSRGLLPVPGGRGWRERRFALVTATDLAGELLRIARDGASGVRIPASYPALSWTDLAEAAGRPVRIVPVPMGLLRLAGHGADLAARLTGRAFVFGAGKAREMACDWRTHGSGLGNLPLAEALQPLMSSTSPTPVRGAPAKAKPTRPRAAPVTEGSS